MIWQPYHVLGMWDRENKLVHFSICIQDQCGTIAQSQKCHVSKRSWYVFSLHFYGYYGEYNNRNNWPLYLDLTTETLNSCKLDQKSSSGSTEPIQPDVLGYYVRETAAILLCVQRLSYGLSYTAWCYSYSHILMTHSMDQSVAAHPSPEREAQWEVGEKFHSTKSHNRMGKNQYPRLKRFGPARGSGCVCSNLLRDFNMVKMKMQGKIILVLIPKICIT